MSEQIVVPHVPRLHDDAARVMRAISTCFGPEFEYAYRAQWDATQQLVHSPQLMARGNRRQVVMSAAGFAPGEIFMHSHPAGYPGEPSDGDLQVANTFSSLHIGFAITDADATALFLVTSPEMIAARWSAAPRPVERHTRALWSLGRLSLTWAPAAAGATR